MTTPVLFSWDGEVMQPLGDRMAKLCDEQFVIGMRYRLVEYEDRSIRSHNHYFASLSTAWNNLPEHLAERFPTPEHLRKYALIKCGFYDSRSIAVKSNAQAREIAKFMAPCDEFSIITASEATVTIYTAKSQSMKAMGKADFAESKQKVLEFVSSLIGTTREQLTHNVSEAA